MPHDQSKPYFDMAHEGALGDRMFQSQLDESFVAHQYIIAAQAAWSANLPDGLWGCEDDERFTVQKITSERTVKGSQKACFDYETLGDELDKAKLSWRFYASQYGSASSGNGGTWSSYQAINHIYNGPDWKKDVISPELEVHHRRPRPASLRTSPGSRRSATTPTTPTARTTTDRRGFRRW